MNNQTKPKIRFVSYDGKYPCLCSGTFKVEIGKKTYRFHPYEYFSNKDILPSTADVAEYLSTSTKQYPKKILDAFRFLSEEHRRITDGAVFSPKVIHRIGYDVFTVI